MILIVGAGIVGLSLGYALVQHGRSVTIVDAGPVAGGASGAATSYLEPRLGTGPTRAIEWESLKRWPDYVKELETQTNSDLGFRTDGQIRVTLEADRAHFEKDVDQRIGQGWSASTLSDQEVREKEPALSPHITASVFLPDVRWVNGPRVCAALAEAICAAGSQILEHWPATSVLRNSGGVQLVGDSGQILRGDQVALCNGLGANDLAGLPDDIPQSLPVRGVNISLDMSVMEHPVAHLIKHRHGSLCPRGNTLIVGTTYEHGITDLEPAPQVIENIYAHAETILPSVRDLPMVGVAAGVRTKVADGSIHLGRSKEMPEIFYSLGHAGAGYLRAPVLAEGLARLLIEGRPPALTAPVTDGFYGSQATG